MWIIKNSHRVRSAPYEKYCKRSRDVASPNRKNHFAAIYGWRAMSNAMPVFLAQKTMTPAVIKIVNYEGARVLFAGNFTHFQMCLEAMFLTHFFCHLKFSVIKTRHAATDANLWRPALNVAKPNMPHVSRRHVVRAINRSVQNHRQWPMVQHAKNVANAVAANAFHIAKHRVYKAVCVISYRMLVNGQ